MHKVILPELGEGIEKAILACWHCQPGAQVGVEDDVAEVVTDKAAFNVMATKSGVVKELLVEEGQEVNVGEGLIVIE